LGVVSHLWGSGVTLEVIDTFWASGGRSLAPNPQDSSEFWRSAAFGSRLVVRGLQGKPNLRWVEIRTPGLRGVALPSSGALSVADWFDLTGLRLPSLFGQLPENVLGTRREVLGDEGPRQTTLCVAFQDDDVVTPATAWVLSRFLPVFANQRGESSLAS
jgi:hypothetical protein